MKHNLTLVIDAGLLKSARKVALDRNTSVSQMVREFLEQTVQQASQRQTALADLENMFRTERVILGPWTWTRDDLHER